MSILERINSSADVKNLNIRELEVLAEEIRGFLIRNISRQGGHLSSNLGTVELTLAIHKVFDVERDRVVWDVGHQSYTHKIITGRRDKFAGLRRKDGISGFPKTSESETDAFNTGHSSTSISAALGFAKAFELDGSGRYAAAVIGDGAITGGMAYEALNHAGSGSTPLIVIFNDNGMSISKNVGGLSQYLEKMSGTARYIGMKEYVKKTVERIPVIGEKSSVFLQRGKRIVKKLLVQKKLFENLGLDYLGPVDGHDLHDLMTVMEYAKKLKRPVIVHVITQKGKGYEPAEQNPVVFHGVQRFDPDTGELLTSEGTTYSDVFGETVVSLAGENKKVVCVTAAMPTGTGLTRFAAKFPKRFFDVGIAEQHAVTFSAAMAKAGYTPVFAVYSSFLQRGYDQILHDAALQKLHVVFAVDRAGAVGSDGETHQGIYDLSYLSHIPNMTVMAPASGSELSDMLRFAVNECSGPVAVRYPKGESDTAVYGGKIEYGKGCAVRKGTDVLIAAIGSEVREACLAADILDSRGVSAGVMNARFLKPFDSELFGEMAKNCKIVAAAENNTCIGGFCAAVQDAYGGSVLKFAFPDEPLRQATVSEQLRMGGIDGKTMAETILKKLGRE